MLEDFFRVNKLRLSVGEISEEVGDFREAGGIGV